MILTQKQREKIINYVKESSSGWDEIHSFENHTLRVVQLAKTLAREENADEEIVEIAAYLHDIGYTNGPEKEHENRGAELARTYLRSMHLPDQFVNIVSQAIFEHSSERQPASTLEGRVLYDADKMQLLGPFGFARALAYHLKYVKPNLPFPKAVIEIEKYQLEKIKLLNTDTAKRIAQKEAEMMKLFYEMYRRNTTF